jgi:hypothetical protein
MKVGMEMMASLHDDVLTAFPIKLKVELLCISTLLRVECKLGKSKQGGSTLRTLCQQLTPHLAQLGQQGQEWQVVGFCRVPGAPPVEGAGVDAGQAGVMGLLAQGVEVPVAAIAQQHRAAPIMGQGGMMPGCLREQGGGLQHSRVGHGMGGGGLGLGVPATHLDA